MRKKSESSDGAYFKLLYLRQQLLKIIEKNLSEMFQPTFHSVTNHHTDMVKHNVLGL